MNSTESLAWDAQETLRHACVRRELFLRSGAEERHVTATMNIVLALRAHLRAAPRRRCKE